jgi:hypothetical protein
MGNHNPPSTLLTRRLELEDSVIKRNMGGKEEGKGNRETHIPEASQG